ncbi:MAG TPA: hypothetical protein VFS59_16150 [Gemmatimonadaceae bacterium]|nr:hypothetical protein [Gemmatimonadaceae bacterium]
MRRSNEGWAASGRLVLGERAIWRVALACLALVGACATGQKTTSEIPPGAVDLNTGQRNPDKTTVLVDNQNLNEMTIYAYQGTQRMRLGRARATGTTELRIPSSIVSGVVQIRFYAEPMVTGGQRSYISEMIPVQPGDQVDFLIPYTR